MLANGGGSAERKMYLLHFDFPCPKILSKLGLSITKLFDIYIFHMHLHKKGLRNMGEIGPYWNENQFWHKMANFFRNFVSQMTRDKFKMTYFEKISKIGQAKKMRSVIISKYVKNTCYHFLNHLKQNLVLPIFPTFQKTSSIQMLTNQSFRSWYLHFGKEKGKATISKSYSIFCVWTPLSHSF